MIKGKTIGIIFVFTLIILFTNDIFAENTDTLNWNGAEKILAQIIAPVFPDKEFSILKYGAKGDGKTDCTKAFAKAIEKCSKAGGGKVIVPEGIYLTGAIHLKSNVNLHVSKNATIKFSTDYKKYLPAVYSRFEGVECMNYSPLIYAYQQENIAVTGTGTLDGSASSTVWWPWKGKWSGSVSVNFDKGIPSQHKDIEDLAQMAKNNVPVEKRIFGDGHYLRPSFVQPYKCKNVLIEGVTLKNSPMWVLHPVLSENITIQKINIISHGPNNDGCDPESCKNVLIKDCFFDTGDDCIAIKSGRNDDGRRVNTPCENLVIQDCIMKEGHGGIVIGSEISGNVKNVFAENCEMDSPHLERAIRIKSNSLRGGTVENLYCRNINVNQTREAMIKINMYYGREKAEYIPSVKNVRIENMDSKNSEYAIWIKAYKENPVENLTIENCTFENIEKGVLIENVSNFNTKNITITTKD